MVEAFHKTCNVKHEIDIKRYGNVKSETDSCQCFCFGLSFRFLFLSYSSLIFHSLMVRWVLSKLIPTFTSRLPSE